MGLFAHYLTLPYLLEGIGYTALITALGLGGGVLVGVVLAAMQLGRLWLLAALARCYTIVFRGTPLILQLVFAYDALPYIGIKLSAVGAAGLALAANEGPFIAEILRAGVLGVDRGQIAAGQALGMTPAVLMRRVIAPQAIRTMVPGLGNEAVSALKNSSLASVIAVPELTLRSTQLASSTFDFFSIFLGSGLMYLGLTSLISLVQLWTERALDLDRVASRQRFTTLLLPWRRARIEAVGPHSTSPPPPEPQAARPRPVAPASVSVSVLDHGRRAEVLARNNKAIAVEGLRKRYGSQTVLDGLDLTVRVGEVVALLGPSGSGKSTLLRCINHLETADAGRIEVGGHRSGFRADGRPLPPRALAAERAGLGVGMVFQQFNLFAHLTARENVAGPLRWVQGVSPADATRRADDLLARVGLGERVGALPRHLSGGQQQRVAIARALAPNPSVLLLDEPTSALDPELVGEVLEVIRKLAVEDGLTMIISTHQLRFAEEVADRIVFLHGGSVAEEGPARELLRNPRHPLTRRFLSRVGADTHDVLA